MSTSTKPTKHRRSFVPTSALARAVNFDDVARHVNLTDGRVMTVPLSWFPALRDATPEQRALCQIGGGGIGLHWDDLDEDISIAGLMAGVDRAAS